MIWLGFFLEDTRKKRPSPISIVPAKCPVFNLGKMAEFSDK